MLVVLTPEYVWSLIAALVNRDLQIRRCIIGLIAVSLHYHPPLQICNLLGARPLLVCRLLFLQKRVCSLMHFRTMIALEDRVSFRNNGNCVSHGITYAVVVCLCSFVSVP